MTHQIFYDGKVHVCAERCSTCIFRPGNLMMLEEGRVEGMVEECLAGDKVIPCHKTLSGDHQAVCRGFFDRHMKDIFPLRFAVVEEVIEFVPADNQILSTDEQGPGSIGSPQGAGA
jgi:hypothetical protein